MKIKIIAVGKIKKGYIKEGVCDYCRRLSRYVNTEVIEVKEEKLGDKDSEAGVQSVKQKEALRILSAVSQYSFVVCLDVEGAAMSSYALAEFLGKKKNEGLKEIIFVIGGHLGFGAEILNRADYTISLSKMTFPHELARLMLTEQLYRSEKILSGEPYHK